ncbi:MAG: glycosyltransferase [Gemmatimonadales bacterium]
MTNGERSHLAIYCPDVPPVPGGVSDHTLVLARALESRGHAPVVLAARGDPSAFAPMVCVTGLRPADVAREAERHGVSTLVLQYVPFLYARFGISPALWRAADALAAHGIQIMVILHEPYVPFTRLPWLVTGWPQRWQLRHLVRLASCVYTPTPAFATIARAFTGPKTRVEVVPVGANYARSSVSRDEARRELGIAPDRVVVGVFSPAASGFALEWVRAAAVRLRPRPDVVWLLLGNGSKDVAGLLAGGNVMGLGRLDAEPLARAMRAIDVAAQPYEDGLTMRRGAAMLLLSNGIATVSSSGEHLDPACAAVAVCEDTAEAFAQRVEQLVADPIVRAQWAAHADAARHLWSVDVMAAAIVNDIASRLSPLAS